MAVAGAYGVEIGDGDVFTRRSGGFRRNRPANLCLMGERRKGWVEVDFFSKDS